MSEQILSSRERLVLGKPIENKKKKPFVVIRNQDPDQFESQVEESIKNGYRLVRVQAVSVGVYVNYIAFLQLEFLDFDK